MASINGLSLINISPEESIDDIEFVFGELCLNGVPLGEFTRRRDMPAYYRQAQYVPEYMYLSIADTEFRWYDGADIKTAVGLFEPAVHGMNPDRGVSICRFVDCLFCLRKIQETWENNDCVPIQCLWNNRAYRIYGLDKTVPFLPHGEAIRLAAKMFASDFGQVHIGLFETEDDFDIEVSDKDVTEDNICFVNQSRSDLKCSCM